MSRKPPQRFSRRPPRPLLAGQTGWPLESRMRDLEVRGVSVCGERAPVTPETLGRRS